MKYIGSLLLLSLITMGASCPSKPTPPTPPGPTPVPPPSASVRKFLKVSPTNPHYFQDDKGVAVLISGQPNLVPSDLDYDYNKDITLLKAGHEIYTRVWHLIPWADNAVWPWAKSGDKWNLDTWNDTYWKRLTDAISKASDSGTTSEIMVFDRCGMSPAEHGRWFSNPWASDNNVNGVETPNKNSDGTPEFYMYQTKPVLRAYQERYVKKLIDETYKYNVIYEVENEHWESKDPGFADHWAIFIKDYLATKGVSRPVSYSSLQDDLESFYTRSSVDIINKHYGDEAERNPDILNQYVESRWHFNKPINIDEFANGVDDPSLLRKEVWTIVMSGGNFHIEDAALESRPQDATDSVHKFLELSQWNFEISHPQKNFIPGGYCMISEGRSYACYFTTSANRTINLPAGRYRYDLFDPINRGINQRIDFDHGGGDKTFVMPSPSEWVIHIRKL